MGKITRALNAEVVFPGARRAQLFGASAPRQGRAAGAADDGRTESTEPDEEEEKSDEGGLWHDLWSARDDLTRAANLLMSALFQLKMGVLEWPRYAEGHSKAGDKVALQTLCYQAFSGKWQPWGKPLYVPTRRRISGQGLSEAAGVVHTRIQTDWIDILQGRKSLPTFRFLPLAVPNQSIQLRDNGHIRIRLWAGRKNNWVLLRYRKLDAGQRMILRDLIRKERKLGSARLVWHQPPQRKGRWKLQIAWTSEVTAAQTNDTEAPAEGLIAAVHLGITSTATIAYAYPDGTISRRKDVVDFPANAIRAWNRVYSDRRKRLAYNRDEVGARTGRGRTRKLRVDRALNERLGRIVDTSVQQLAAVIVSTVKRRGATVLVLEDLTHWSRDNAMDELLRTGTNADRARHRRWYFTWKRGMLFQQISAVADREGLQLLVVNARGVSWTCSACGNQWPRSGVYAHHKRRKVEGFEGTPQEGTTDAVPLVGPHGSLREVQGAQGAQETRYGRIRWSGKHSFWCSCGCRLHADRNAAINDVKRGVEALNKLAAK